MTTTPSTRALLAALKAINITAYEDIRNGPKMVDGKPRGARMAELRDAAMDWAYKIDSRYDEQPDVVDFTLIVIAATEMAMNVHHASGDTESPDPTLLSVLATEITRRMVDNGHFRTKRLLAHIAHQIREDNAPALTAQ